MSDEDFSEYSALLHEGETAWERVRKKPILLAYKNPAFRFSMIATVLISTAGGLWTTFGGPSAFFCVVLALTGLASAAAAVKFFLGERAIGALLCEITKNHIAVGCPKDRLIIPWSAVDTSAATLPLGEAFAAVPIRADARKTLVLDEDGQAPLAWDGQAYRRFILEVRYNESLGWVEIASDPNEFQIKILRIVYPMLLYLRERGPAA